MATSVRQLDRNGVRGGSAVPTVAARTQRRRLRRVEHRLRVRLLPVAGGLLLFIVALLVDGVERPRDGAGAAEPPFPPRRQLLLQRHRRGHGRERRRRRRRRVAVPGRGRRSGARRRRGGWLHARAAAAREEQDQDVEVVVVAAAPALGGGLRSGRRERQLGPLAAAPTSAAAVSTADGEEEDERGGRGAGDEEGERGDLEASHRVEWTRDERVAYCVRERWLSCPVARLAVAVAVANGVDWFATATERNGKHGKRGTERTTTGESFRCASFWI